MLSPTKAVKFCLFFFGFTVISGFANLNGAVQAEFDFDNPCLCLRAIQIAYSDIAGEVFFDSSELDWAIEIRGTVLYWAHGRLLEKGDIPNTERWAPYISYLYPQKTPNPRYFTKQLIEALQTENLIGSRQKSPPPNYTFYHLVYEGKNEYEINQQLRNMYFLGKKILVHKRIVTPLLHVQAKLRRLEKTDKHIKQFLKTIKSCWGFNWRVIADSGKLSNHSWGIAVDILPNVRKNVRIYWLWEAYRNSRWMLLAPEKRWNPPEAVITAFESEGFIWGGRWELWDNMHFEYRPELIVLQDFLYSKNEYMTPCFNEIKEKDTELYLPFFPAVNINEKKDTAKVFRLITK